MTGHDHSWVYREPVPPTERSIMSESTRAYIYRGIVGTVPLLVGYGVISDNLAPLWIGAAAGWLGAGLATANTDRRR